MTDTLPPHSLTDERGVLACVIENSQDCLPECHGVTDESFYDQRNKVIWSVINDLQKSDAIVDSISVTRKLAQMDSKELAFTYIPEMLNSAGSSHALAQFLPHLFDFEVKRRLIRGCDEVSRMAQEGGSSNDLIAKAEALLSVRRADAPATHDGCASAKVLLDDLERRSQLQGKRSGLETGLYQLDVKTDGLQFGEQTLIGARPSRGKTALGLGIFYHTAFKNKIPSLFVSLEMSTAALMRRMMSCHCEMNMGQIRQGSYTEGHFKSMTTFAGLCRRAPFHIVDGIRGMSIGMICSMVRRTVRKHGIKLVVVDYMQKIKPDERHEKRTYEIAEVSGRLKGLAEETSTAFLTLAQLNRESEKDKGRSPRLSDLGDSGQIERDADTVVLIDRQGSSSETKLIVAKQRDGETGIANVVFNGAYCRFENPSMVETDYHDR